MLEIRLHGHDARIVPVFWVKVVLFNALSKYTLSSLSFIACCFGAIYLNWTGFSVDWGWRWRCG